MTKYVLTNDGNVYVLWSENSETVHVMTQEEYNGGNYDIENIICKEIPNDEIACIDSNIELINLYKRQQSGSVVARGDSDNTTNIAVATYAVLDSGDSDSYSSSSSSSSCGCSGGDC